MHLLCDQDLMPCMPGGNGMLLPRIGDISCSSIAWASPVDSDASLAKNHKFIHVSSSDVRFFIAFYLVHLIYFKCTYFKYVYVFSSVQDPSCYCNLKTLP